MRPLKLFLDSSFVIYLRYAESDEVESYVHRLLERAVGSGSRLLVNMSIIDEAIWILTRKYRIPIGNVLEFMDRLGPLFDVVALDYMDYDAMKEAITEYRLRPSDALHVASMRRTGAVYIASEDEEFDKIPWVRRVWLGTRYETPIFEGSRAL